MPNSNSDVSTLDELRQFVQETICIRMDLLPGACQLEESILVRNGRPCGLEFRMNGPRAVRYSAIWNSSRGSVLFYGCNGERFLRTDLTAHTTLEDELVDLMTAA